MEKNLHDIDAGKMNQTTFAGPTRLDQVTRRQDDSANGAGSDGRVGMIDAHLSHQTRASRQIGAPRSEQSDVARHGRHLGHARVMEHVRVVVESDDATPFDQRRVPQVSFAQHSVEQLAGRRFDFSRHPPQPQGVAVADLLPRHIDPQIVAHRFPAA